MNEGLLTPLQQGQQQAPQEGARPANEQEQAEYKTIVTQILQYCMTNDVVSTIEQMAKSAGPAKALAFVVSHAVEGVGKAAMEAGKDVSMQTGQAALGEVLTVMANVMKDAGMTDDADALAQEAMELLMTGGKNPAQEQAEPQPMGA